MGVTRPNVVVVVTDDQGYGDLSLMPGAFVRTPNLDALAASGAHLRSFYPGSAVCSPSRAAILSGRYPGNAGVRSILGGRRTETGMPTTVPSLAAMLKPLGYRTAQIGKWHLGAAPDYRPDAHGFDSWYGFLAGCVDYYSHLYYFEMPESDPLHDLWDNGREVFDNGRYLTEAITERACREIREAAGRGQPFFAYVAYNAPHYPMHAPRGYVDRFPDLPPDRRIMAAMLAAADDGIGAIVAELERLGVRDDTIIFFGSDNGPSRETRNWLEGTTDPYYGGTTGSLRGHKFSLFEGGIRTPGIVSWPARIPAAQAVDAPVCGMDIAPTVLAAASNPAAHDLDGVDVVPLLTGAAPAERDLFWELGGQTAMRRGRHKLLLHPQQVEEQPPTDAVFLADLDADPGERHNLAEQQPDLVREMTAAATAWRAGVEHRWAALARPPHR